MIPPPLLLIAGGVQGVLQNTAIGGSPGTFTLSKLGSFTQTGVGSFDKAKLGNFS